MKIFDCLFIVSEVEIIAGRVAQYGRWGGDLGVKAAP
jgi:hypothetical protein